MNSNLHSKARLTLVIFNFSSAASQVMDQPHAVDANETTALLPDSERVSTTPQGTQLSASQRQWIFLLICASVVACDFGNCLSIAPQLQIVEGILCRQIHGGDSHASSISRLYNSTEPICKAPDVQGELALLNGWKETFDQIPGIFVAVPFGLMADRVGRKPVLLLAVVGLLMEDVSIKLICWWSDFVSLKTIWLTPLFQLSGGGAQVATGIAYTMISDLYPVEKRSQLFFTLAASILLGEILATPLSAYLMAWTPWLPALLGVVFELGGLAVAFSLKETRKPKLTQITNDSDDHNDAGHPGQDTTSPITTRTSWRSNLRRRWAIIYHQSAFIHTSTNMICIILAFLTASLGKQVLNLMIQYASRRFSWSIAQASLLITLKGAVNLVLLLLLLPNLSRFLNRYIHPIKRDFYISQFSVAILTIGSLFLALAAHPALFVTGVCIFAIGWGFYSTLRSVATALVSSDQIGVLNTTIALAQSVGVMIAGPTIAAAFRKGIELGGVWLGLPYMFGAALFSVATILTTCIKVPHEP